MYLKYCDLFILKYLQIELKYELKQIHQVREHSNIGTIEQSQSDKLSFSWDPKLRYL
jgi:hypothetical protein